MDELHASMNRADLLLHRKTEIDSRSTVYGNYASSLLHLGHIVSILVCNVDTFIKEKSSALSSSLANTNVAILKELKIKLCSTLGKIFHRLCKVFEKTVSDPGRGLTLDAFRRSIEYLNDILTSCPVAFEKPLELPLKSSAEAKDVRKILASSLIRWLYCHLDELDVRQHESKLASENKDVSSEDLDFENLKPR